MQKWNLFFYKMNKAMKLTELHAENKSVSAKPLFKGDVGQVISLQIIKEQKLKEHITKTPALLICVQ